MANEYRKFRLHPKQKAPDGSTGEALKSGWIVWFGDADTFPDDIESDVLSKDEISEFLNPTPSTDESLLEISKTLKQILEALQSGK